MRTHFASEIRRRLSAARARKLVLTVAAAAVLAAIVLGWFSTRHLVRADRGLVVVPKRFVTLSGTFADVRGWTWDDAQAHADLRMALFAAGYEDVLPSPPPEPTTVERIQAKAADLADDVVEAGSNAWSKVREWAK